MSIRIMLLALVALSSCSSREAVLHIRHCETPTDEHRAWVSQCIKDTNPMSDEDPEDMIEQCAATATHLFCPLVKQALWVQGLDTVRKELCPHAIHPIAKRLCQ